MQLRISRTLPVIAAFAAALYADVATDYNHKVDFGRYHTYSWIGVKAGNQLWQDRIMSAVDSQLAAKGWTKVASGGDACGSPWKDQRTGHPSDVVRRISRLGLGRLGRHVHHNHRAESGRDPDARHLRR